MGYKIITDSTIDMDHKMIEELGLTVVPLRFTIDGKTYKDKADLSDMPRQGRSFGYADGNFLRKAARGQNVHHIADQRR